MHFVCAWLVIRLLYVFAFVYLVCLLLVCLCVQTYHMRNNYVMYIVVMQLYFGGLDGCI